MAQIRTLGVDIGIASIGWALLEGELEEDKVIHKEILASGVRIFTKAETPKKESLALPRRIARSARRRTRRKRERMLQIKSFLSSSLGIPLEAMFQEEKLAPLFQTSKTFLSPWQLRAKALDELLSKEELARVILHIAKSRGYDDLTYGLKDTESGKIKKSITNNLELLREYGYRSIGEMMFKLYYQKERQGITPMQWDNVRNKDEDYKRCVGRSELRKELEIIFDTQEKLGNPLITLELREKLLGKKDAKEKREREGLIFYQRPLKSFEGKLGKCQFFKDDKDAYRACKQSPSAEEFIALTKIINFLMYLKNHYGDVSYSQESIVRILDEAKKQKSGLSYAKLRELLNLPSDFSFRELDSSKKDAEKAKFISLESSYIFSKILPELDRTLQDQVSEILGANKDWAMIEKRLKEIGLSANQIETINKENLSFSKHINLSLKALKYILPLMREGRRYDEAVSILQEQGIFKPLVITKNGFLPPLCEIAKQNPYFDISNPVITRALSEFRKVVNALLLEYGNVHYFNIELTREAKQSKSEREKTEKSQSKNQQESQNALKFLQEWGVPQNAKNKLKARLWIQQNGQCLYTGEKITREHFLDETRLQVDHALPLSRSLDDSMSNKVLCLTTSNQNKLNRTPYEWFGNDEKKWNAYEGLVHASRFPENKKKKLLRKNFKDASIEGFLARNLVDTGYIGNVVKEYVKTSLEFLPLPNKKEHIRVIPGVLTSTLRHFWGLEDKNRDSHLHHAQDAIIIACIQASAIQAYAKFLQERETKEKAKIRAQALSEKDYKTRLAMRLPMQDFREKVERSISSITVSHKASHKVTGALHKETLRKREDYYKEYGGEIGVQKALKLGKIRQIDRGIVDNGEMVRVDVFKSRDKGKFYAVPIYTYDFACAKLPNYAIVYGKTDGVIKDWLLMDENYEFCFSLFKNDCVRIQTKEMQKCITVLYKGTHSGTGSMMFEHLSGKLDAKLGATDEKLFFRLKSEERPLYQTSQGIQNLQVFEKLTLSPLGKIKECKKTKRQEIRIKSSPKK